MPTIKQQLNLTEDQVANADIASVASTIVGRIIVGPLCDHYGGRIVQSVLLVLGSVPVAAAALATDYVGFVTIHFFIGLVGCSFVATAYWTSVMFSKEVVGSANAIATGWGNFDAGVTYLVTINGAIGDDIGWRVTLVFPALCMATIGLCLYYFSDDCPQGNYSDLYTIQAMDGTSRPEEDMTLGLLTVIRKPVTWVLLLQYACSFGVEIQVHNVLSLYYFEDFKIHGCGEKLVDNGCHLLSQTQASLISSCFGLMCNFARAVGGQRVSQTIFPYLFSRMKTLEWSIPCLIMFGISAQACTGSTYGIVPYVCPAHVGATSGIVGAGGNLGGLAWGFLFKGVGNRAKSFELLSSFVAVATLMSLAICVEGESSFWGNEELLNTSSVPAENIDDRDSLSSVSTDRLMVDR